MTQSSITTILAATVSTCLLSVEARAASIPAQAAVSIDQANLMSKAAVIEDLTYFRDVWAPKERALTPQARARFVSFINDEIASARPMSRAALALVFARGQAFTGNGHSGSNYAEGLFHSLPIGFWLFGDGAFVTGTARDHRDLIGARIKSIGGVAIADAVERIAQFIAGNSQRKRYLAPDLLTQMEPLEASGLAKDGKALFEFVLRSGRTRRTIFTPASGTVARGDQSPWVAALAPSVGKDDWAHVIDNARERPLYLRSPDELTMSRIGDGSIAYIRSTGLSRSSVVLPKAYVIMDDMVKPGQRPHDAVVDLRFNGGGNFFNIIDFAAELAALIPPDGRIYVITGRATFSAAIVFEALLKGNARGRTVIVGEPIGDNPEWWSEGSTLTAPNSKLTLDYTTGYHDWAHGCKDLDRCYWPVVFHGVAAGTLDPDISIDMTFNQYDRGDDPSLAVILSDVAERRGAGAKH